MSDRKIEPQNNVRNPDGDLAFAFFGSIAVGVLSPTIPLVASGLLFGFSHGWLGALWVPLAMWGSVAGMVWGILNVIVSATATLEKRRTTTRWMFAILLIALMAAHLLLMRGVADV